MAGQYRDDLDPAGCLVFRSADQPDFGRHHYVYTHQEVDIGRTFIEGILGFEDRTISKHHLRIRCIGYDGDGESGIAPMIYARVLSGNTAKLIRKGFDDDGHGVELGRDQGDVLLNPGDHLRLTDNVCIDMATMEEQPQPPDFDATRDVERQRFAHQYRLSKRILGAGAIGAVYIAVKQKTNQQFACKVVPFPTSIEHCETQSQEPAAGKDAILRRNQEKMTREYTLLMEMSHPNVISLEKVIRTSHNIYIFQELLTGGDLLSYLDKSGAVPEPQAAMITRQLLEAVKYLHDNQVVHRDIKPENILMTSWRDGTRVVLTDFGHSITMKDMENAAKKAGVFRMHSMVGTNGYTAPEVYRRTQKDLQGQSGYSQAIDIWSIGCVTSILLVNDYIFPDGPNMNAEDMTIAEMEKHISKIDSDSQWQKIGHRAKSFVKGCLATDENKRLTAQQCIYLPWFQHPHYKAEFDAAYKNAIKGWKPREVDEDVVSFMDTSDIAVDRREPTPEEDTRSQYFQPVSTYHTVDTHEDPNDLVGRFRPYLPHASPAHVPDSISEEYGDMNDPDLDDIDRKLDLATQNSAANRAALRIDARQAPFMPTQRKRIYR